MSRTYKKDMNSVMGWDRETATKIGKTRKPTMPQNKPSKRYQSIEDGCFYDYDAGHQYGQSHKTNHALNQSLNQRARTIEKREFKKELNNELNENN